MPANTDPASSSQDDQFAVQTQGVYRRPAASCTANDLGPVLAPGKMLCPYLGAWVEQRNDLTCLGISRVGLAAFELVAARAYQPQILSHRWSAARFGQNVVDNQLGRTDKF